MIYLISCRKCAVQYVGETSQTPRCRFNNHRSRLKQLCGLYLYHHFSSDIYTLDDISIMPIEEIVLEPSDVISLPSKSLQREEYWYRELCTVYPYGLNDNVKGVGICLVEVMMDWWCMNCLISKRGSLGTAQHIGREGKLIAG